MSTQQGLANPGELFSGRWNIVTVANAAGGTTFPIELCHNETLLTVTFPVDVAGQDVKIVLPPPGDHFTGFRCFGFVNDTAANSDLVFDAQNAGDDSNVVLHDVSANVLAYTKHNTIAATANSPTPVAGTNFKIVCDGQKWLIILHADTAATVA